MDKKLFGIGILSITAIVLLMANFMPLQTASARDTIRDRDYQMVTARLNAGGDALYVTDNRTGMMAVFTWDATRREVVIRDVRAIEDAFTR